MIINCPQKKNNEFLRPKSAFGQRRCQNRQVFLAWYPVPWPVALHLDLEEKSRMIHFKMLLHVFCLVLSYLLVARTFGNTIKVLTTQEDLAKFSDGSGARLKDAPVVDLEDVTVCLRF